MSDVASRFHNIFAPVITFENEIEVVEGQGTWVTDADGKRYLDFACGIAVTNLGHRPPAVEAAVHEQVGKLWHAGGSFLYDSIVTAAEKIVEVSPDGIDRDRHRRQVGQGPRAQAEVHDADGPRGGQRAEIKRAGVALAVAVAAGEVLE